VRGHLRGLRSAKASRMWGPFFDLKRPRKLFQDFFTPRSAPDPEFKPLDMRALGVEHPDSPEKGENPDSKGDKAAGS
jgi:hypothetical protein